LIKAITFDLWNTLLVEKHYTERRISILADALRGEGQRLDWEALRFAYSAAQRRHDDIWSREHRHYHLSDRLDDTLRDAGVTLTSVGKAEVMDKFGDIIIVDPPQLTEGADETVTALSERFRLGVISDTGVTPGAKIRELLNHVGILGCFRVTVFSDETGICKPRRDAFDAALRGLAVRPSEVMHVGDLLRTDVAGAKAAGWKGVWLKVREPDAEDVSPDYTITRLPELLKITEIADTA
jgi:putative hydrolase of the HAD superfamily